MKFGIVIPVHNEAAFLERCVLSLVKQHLPPEQIILVDDQSSDDTPRIIGRLCAAHSRIRSLRREAGAGHLPGAKVVAAFNAGLPMLPADVDVVCKFDADLVFPPNYLSELAAAFHENEKLGITGGQCTVERGSIWVPETVADPDHVRGALKAYRKACFQDIGGLREAMGWDTLDELLAMYHGWQVNTVPRLSVMHLRPTGHTYTPAARKLKGEALYTMGYGLVLGVLASAKMAKKEGQPLRVFDHLQGYFAAAFSGKKLLVKREEMQFIRKLRWQRIMRKFKA